MEVTGERRAFHLSVRSADMLTASRHLSWDTEGRPAVASRFGSFSKVPILFSPLSLSEFIFFPFFSWHFLSLFNTHLHVYLNFFAFFVCLLFIPLFLSFSQLSTVVFISSPFYPFFILFFFFLSLHFSVGIPGSINSGGKSRSKGEEKIVCTAFNRGAFY